MVLPTKHENLNKNLLVLGADILKQLKNGQELTIEDAFQKIKSLKDIGIDKFYDTILYLWILDFIEFDNFNLKLKEINNVSD